MGVFFGIVNLLIIIWFYSSAVSVKKPAVMWAIIGGVSFLIFKWAGYYGISLMQGGIDASNLDGLVSQGYEVTSESADNLASESDDSSYFSFLGVFYEFFPLICALLGTAFIRAKFILGMGFVESFKHQTSFSFVTSGHDEDTDEPESSSSALDAKVFAKIQSFFQKKKDS